MVDPFVRLPNAEDGGPPLFVAANRVAIIMKRPADGVTAVFVAGFDKPMFTTRSVQGVRSAVTAVLRGEEQPGENLAEAAAGGGLTAL